MHPSSKIRIPFALGLALAGLSALAPMPASGQTERPHWVKPEGSLPRAARGDRSKNLDFLFEALKAAPDEDSAKHVEHRIWALWFASGSDTADLLMSRVKTAIEKSDSDLAMKLLNAVIELKPDFVEGWNQRASIYFVKKDYGRALADLSQVLAREPRHFGAWAGLGAILQDMGEDKRALDAYRRALSLHPRLQRIPDVVKGLTEKVEGRDI